MTPTVILAIVLGLLLFIAWIQENTFALICAAIGLTFVILVLTGVAPA